MDAIFKALNDPARRALLDSLRRKDGQTLSDLEAQLDMTRFGVMKHLGVLEDAKLITTKKKGRFKHHYLNVVPLQEVIERWIEPLIAQPVARSMIALKAQLEGIETMTDASKPDFVHQTFIRTSVDALWDALTKAEVMAQFHHASSAARQMGDGIAMLTKDGGTMLIHRILSSDPKSRIELSFEPGFPGADTSSRVVFMIEPEGPICKLTCEHFGVSPGLEPVREGWARWCASLKSFLENGTPIRQGAA